MNNETFVEGYGALSGEILCAFTASAKFKAAQIIAYDREGAKYCLAVLYADESRENKEYFSECDNGVITRTNSGGNRLYFNFLPYASITSLAAELSYNDF